MNVVGGCCGSTPAHIAACARRSTPSISADTPRAAPSASVEPGAQFVASAMTAVSLEQEPRPLLVGERINSQGSRKIKRLLLDDDYDEISLVAREQVEGGAHVLDVCCALTERADEDAQMREVVRKLAQSIEAPLMIDSTEPRVVAVALQNYPGRAIVNSVHLEAGRAKMDVVLPLAVEHGAAVVALTIDEAGMAKTAERKLEVANASTTSSSANTDSPPGALIFDDLTFTLATGDPEFAIRRSRRSRASARSNASCRACSRRSASRTSPSGSNRRRAPRSTRSSCITAWKPDSTARSCIPKTSRRTSKSKRRCASSATTSSSTAAPTRWRASSSASKARAAAKSVARHRAMRPKKACPSRERIHNAILRRRKDGIEAKIDLALQERSPVDVLNEILLPAMKDVGDRFGRGELILPFVLQSAEVMKKAVAHLEQFLEKQGRRDQGHGRARDRLRRRARHRQEPRQHDPDQQRLHRARSRQASADERDPREGRRGQRRRDRPVGAARLDQQADADLRARAGRARPAVSGHRRRRGDQPRFRPAHRAARRRRALLRARLFYAKDAFEGLEIMDALTSGAATRREALVERARERSVRAARPRSRRPSQRRAEGVDHLGRKDQPRRRSGSAVLGRAHARRRSTLRRALAALRSAAASTASRGAPPTQKATRSTRSCARNSNRACERYRRESRRRKAACSRASCTAISRRPASATTSILYDPQDPSREIARFAFARQPGGEHLSLADYLREPEDGRGIDVVALQVVTVGTRAGETTESAAGRRRLRRIVFRARLLGASRPRRSPNATHRRIRTRAGTSTAERGKRYSWGYGACPDLSQHEIALPFARRARTGSASTLTEAYQIVPEQSTAAIVIHHPRASLLQRRRRARGNRGIAGRRSSAR